MCEPKIVRAYGEKDDIDRVTCHIGGWLSEAATYKQNLERAAGNEAQMDREQVRGPSYPLMRHEARLESGRYNCRSIRPNGELLVDDHAHDANSSAH